MVTIRNGLFLSLFITGFNGVVLHLLLKWAFDKSNKVFFGILFGGMGWKLFTLALLTAVIFKNNSFHLVTTLLAFVFFSTLFSFFSIHFLPRKLGQLPVTVPGNCPN